MADVMESQITKNIVKEVKKQTAHLKKSTFEDEAVSATAGITSQGADLKSVLRQKAEYKDIEDLRNTKANRQDAEMAIRSIEILHKQMMQICLVLTQRLKMSLDKDNTDGLNSKINKKVHLL